MPETPVPESASAFDALPPERRRALEIILAGGSQADAAQGAGVHPSRVSRWKRTDAWKAARLERTGEQLDQADAVAADSAPIAMAELRRQMADDSLPARDRREAANALLAHAFRDRELAPPVVTSNSIAALNQATGDDAPPVRHLRAVAPDAEKVGA